MDSSHESEEEKSLREAELRRTCLEQAMKARPLASMMKDLEGSITNMQTKEQRDESAESQEQVEALSQGPSQEEKEGPSQSTTSPSSSPWPSPSTEQPEPHEPQSCKPTKPTTSRKRKTSSDRQDQEGEAFRCGLCDRVLRGSELVLWPGCGCAFCPDCLGDYLLPSRVSNQDLWLGAIPHVEFPNKKDLTNKRIVIGFPQDINQVLKRTTKGCPNSSECGRGGKYTMHPFARHHLVLPRVVARSSKARVQAGGKEREELLNGLGKEKFGCPFDEDEKCTVQLYEGDAKELEKQLEHHLPHGWSGSGEGNGKGGTYASGVSQLAQDILQSHLTECVGMKTCTSCGEHMTVSQAAEHALVNCQIVTHLKRFTEKLPELYMKAHAHGKQEVLMGSLQDGVTFLAQAAEKIKQCEGILDSCN